MKIDFNVKMKDSRGKTLAPGGEEFRVVDAVCQALQEVPDENDGPAHKRRRSNLANNIRLAKGPIEISQDDIDCIRRLVDKGFPGALIFSQVDAVLSEAEKKAEQNTPSKG